MTPVLVGAAIIVAAIGAPLSWPWPTLAAAAAFIASLAGFARWARKRGAAAVGKLRGYLDERTAEVAAAISDPIVTEVRNLRKKVGEVAHEQRSHTTECRIDRDAIWAQLGGRPGAAIPRSATPGGDQ